MNNNMDRDITKIINNRDDSFLWTSKIGGYVTYGDGCLWRICDDELWSIDINTAKVSYIADLKIDGVGKKCFCKSVYSTGKVYCLPVKSSSFIRCYDVKTGKIKSYDTQKNIDKYLYFTNITYKDEIYIFSTFGESVLVINTINDSVYDVDLSYENRGQLRENTGFLRKLVCVEDKVIIPSRTDNRILIFDLKNKRCEWKLLKELDAKISNITKVENDLYLLANNNILYKIDLNFENSIMPVYQFVEQYSAIYSISNFRILLVPKYRNKIAIFSLLSNKLTYFEYPNEYFFTNDYKWLEHFNIVGEFDNTIYLSSWYSNMLILIDKCTGKMTSNKWKLELRECELLVNKIMNQNNTISESYMSLSNFVNYINYASEKDNDDNFDCGEKIFHLMT